MKHYTSSSASTEGTHVTSSAQSDGIRVVFYHGPAGLDGSTCINLDDTAARQALVQITAALADRGIK